MNYELARSLKDAGFPQGSFTGDHHDGGAWIDDEDKPYVHNCDSDTECYIPTLSELIGACGKDFHCLVHTTTGGIDSDREFWSASTTKYARDFHNGPTPEETIAKLWLALNKK